MASPILDPLKAKQIDALLAKGLSNAAIVGKLSVGYMTVARRRAAGGFPATNGRIPVILTEKDLCAAIQKTLKKSPMSDQELADALNVKRRQVVSAIRSMKERGSMISLNAGGQYEIIPAFAAAAGRGEAKASKDNGEWDHVFGFVTDNHLCNKHSRLDVLNAAYDTFARMGISTVYNAGNWIDGEARFNKTELIVRPGVDAQIDYMIQEYPQREGITTEYIAGDDHEGWYSQREGLEIGRYLQNRAREQGRQDLKYLGYAEADIALRYGNNSAVMRIVHPGGGSAYAISYTDQKRLESYQGGEKPSVELVGHYHKWNSGYPREVHTVQGGCTCDQTLFMRKKRLQAHVGFVIIKIKQDASDGRITRFAPEWVPFFDRGFYEKRF